MALWKNVAKTCGGLPTPAVPAVALSGLAFNQVIRPFRSLAGRDFLATMTCGLLPRSAMGSKSFSTSYFREWMAAFATCVVQIPMTIV